MKLFKYGLPLAALAVLASCSNDNIDAPVGGQTPEVGDGSMYMTVNISLPEVSGSRADDDASFGGYEVGTDDENEVRKVVLYLFKGADGETDADKNATFVKAITLGFGGMSDGDKVDVSNKFQATFQIDDIKLDPTTKKPVDESGAYSLWGLLVVNPSAKLPALVANTTTFNAWNNTAMIDDAKSGSAYYQVMTDAGFQMTNAPELTGGKASTLVELETANFATSPAAATEPAADFYVQRGVAKVQLTKDDNADFNGMPVYDGSVDDQKKLVAKGDAKVQLENWALDVTNHYTFPSQNVIGTDDATNYTVWTASYFTAAASGTQGVNNHIWWGIDPNYFGSTDDADLANSFTKIGENDNFTLTPADYAYCLENTMIQTQQLQGQTTRVVFKCKYIFDGEKEEDKETWANTDKHVGFIVFNDKAMLVKKADIAENYETAGEVALSTLVPDADKQKTYLEGLMMGDATNTVTYYPGGVTYYVAYIRHFNDNEAKLPTPAPNLSSLTKTDISSWGVGQLGRYGVLRNNVYKMNITGFYGYGLYEIPEPDPNIPDDKEPEIKYNAIVDINILQWAIRQNDYMPR